MIEWLKQNKLGVGMVGAAILLVAVLIASQGCSVYDLVKMTPSPKFQQVTGAPPVITLNEYPEYRQDFVDNTAKELQRNDAEFNKQDWLAGLITSGLSMGIETGEAYAKTLPGGAALATVVAGVGALFLRKPGDGKVIASKDEQIQVLKDELARQALAALEKLKDEKIASFNKGLEQGKANPA